MCCFSWVWSRARRGLSVPDWFLVLWWLSVVKWMITPRKMLPKKWKNAPPIAMWTLTVATRMLTKVSFSKNSHALSYVTFSMGFWSQIIYLIMSLRQMHSRHVTGGLGSCDHPHFVFAMCINFHMIILNIYLLIPFTISFKNRKMLICNRPVSSTFQ